MGIIKQVKNDLKSYKEYILYMTKTELKVQLSSTYLGYLWWLLDPLMYMLVYMLVVTVIFQTRVENFAIFVFCSVLSWKWTTSSIMESTNSIKARAGILQQVYIPKFILPLIKSMVNATKFLFGVLVLLGLILFYRIPYSIHNLEFLFVFIVNFIFILGMSFILAHLGVFFRDINNILNFTLRLWFYLSPGFYALDRIPEKVRFLWWLNPLTAIFESYRNVFMYNKSPLYLPLFIWLLISISLVVLGLKYLYKFDKNYTKVV